jgi:hypothetical protein
MKKFLHLLLALPLIGCVSNVHHIGNIGENKYYSIHEQSLNGPNVAVIAVQTPEGINYLTSATGPGIATAVVGAGGNVGASALLRPARSSVTVSGNGESSASAASAASASSSGSSSSFVPPGQVGNPGHNK